MALATTKWVCSCGSRSREASCRKAAAQRLPVVSRRLRCPWLVWMAANFSSSASALPGSPIVSLYQATITQRDSHDGNGLVRGALEVVEADRVLNVARRQLA